MVDIPEHLLESREPFLVCSRKVLKRQAERLESMGLDVFYSVKTNPEPRITKELARLGCGFSVPEPKEFLRLLSMDVEPERMLYHERALTKNRVEKLAKAGCRNFTVENKPSFENLMARADGDFTVLVRVRGGGSGSKYAGRYSPGLNVREARRLIKEAGKRGLRTGVLHHGSSQIEEPRVWEEKFRLLSKFPDADVVNIGGGMPIEYNGEEHEGVLEEIKRGGKELGAGRLMAEPGRFIVGPACTLAARVEMIDGRNAILDCSVYGAHIDTIIAGLVLPCRVAGREGDGKKIRYRLLGSSLCNLDVFDEAAELPQLGEGDVVVFDNAGAYNFSSSFGPDGGIRTYVVD